MAARVKKAGGGGRGPVVKVRSVKAPPPPARAMLPSQTRYRDAMAEVRRKGKRGGWHEIATYASPAGAALVRRDIVAGRRLIDGRVGDWVIESRRLHDEASGACVGSALYVKLK